MADDEKGKGKVVPFARKEEPEELVEVYGRTCLECGCEHFNLWTMPGYGSFLVCAACDTTFTCFVTTFDEDEDFE